MFKRPSVPGRPANLCNLFLLEYLANRKSLLQRSGMQRRAITYLSAMASIRKYPLPIISGQQLKNIYGIGEALCEELLIVIKHHYRDFMKKRWENCMNEGVGPKDNPYPIENDEDTRYKNNSKSLAHSNTFLTRPTSQDMAAEDSKSCLSVKSATIDRQYKPRAGSLPAYIMIGIHLLGRGQFVKEQNLKQTLTKEYGQKTEKQYSLAVVNLIQNGYLQRDQLDQSYLRLTERGSAEVQKLQNKTKIKESQIKVQSLAVSFRENRLIKKEQPTNQQIQQNTMEQTIATDPSLPLVLLIDNRQRKDQQEQCFFQTRLQDKHGIICRGANLPLGDFVWVYGDQVLDYVVQRKKADDLLSSIFDGRYKEQKYRLRNSGISNIYYLFQGHLTGQNAMSQKEVISALLKTRVKEEFKVVQVKSITQSVKFLHFMTQSIRKKIASSSQMKTLGTMEQFAANNGKSSKMTVQHIFGLSLKTIPGVGKASVSEILRYFSSFKSLYNQLKLLEGQIQRVQFLRQVLKGCGVARHLPQLLVQLLFVPYKK